MISAGKITSKTSNKSYEVLFDNHKNEAWIILKENTKQQVCNNVFNELQACECAQRYIDGQPRLY